MRFLIATAFTPFADEPDLAGPLAGALRRRGAETDIVRLPVAGTATGWKEQLVAWRLLELDLTCGDPIHRMIALASPAEALRHPAKTVWVVRDLPDGVDRDVARRFRAEARQIHFASSALQGGETGGLLPIPDDECGWDNVAEVLAR